MDFALIAQAATLESRVPFLHFFDGFRTSHEVAKIEQLTDDDMRAMIDDELVRAHRARALSPDHPVMRGTAQNPDVYFQARETVNPFYLACPTIVQNAMDQFARARRPAISSLRLCRRAGCRARHRHDGFGRRSGAGNRGVSGCAGRKGGRAQSAPVPAVLRSSISSAPCPLRSRNIAVLDRTKEPGAIGEPLYLDVRHRAGRGVAR